MGLPVIPVVERLRQEGCSKFETSLGYTVRPYPKPPSPKRKENMKKAVKKQGPEVAPWGGARSSTTGACVGQEEPGEGGMAMTVPGVTEYSKLLLPLPWRMLWS